MYDGAKEENQMANGLGFRNLQPTSDDETSSSFIQVVRHYLWAWLHNLSER